MFVVLLGAPAAGKGTQARLLSARYGWPHISSGELLRSEIARGTPFGRAYAPHYAQGELASTAKILELIRNRIEEPDAARGAIFDGFPRTVLQARALDRMLRTRGTRIGAALHLYVPEQTLRARMRGRAATGRTDDTDATFTKRYADYKTDSVAVLTYYGDRLFSLNAEGSIEEVDHKVRKILRSLSP